MNVLVVEDDASIRETLGMVLAEFGHQSSLVHDGEEALSYLESNWPDAILLDLSLPGMNGEEAYERIVSRFGKAPPTVVLSAVQEGERRIKHLPGTWFLAKPYTIEQLVSVL